jgi:hypothetical protein
VDGGDPQLLPPGALSAGARACTSALGAQRARTPRVPALMRETA